jgi:hypothetical protein
VKDKTKVVRLSSKNKVVAREIQMVRPQEEAVEDHQEEAVEDHQEEAVEDHQEEAVVHRAKDKTQVLQPLAHNREVRAKLGIIQGDNQTIPETKLIRQVTSQIHRFQARHLFYHLRFHSL